MSQEVSKRVLSQIGSTILWSKLCSMTEIKSFSVLFLVSIGVSKCFYSLMMATAWIMIISKKFYPAEKSLKDSIIMWEETMFQQ